MSDVNRVAEEAVLEERDEGRVTMVVGDAAKDSSSSSTSMQQQRSRGRLLLGTWRRVSLDVDGWENDFGADSNLAVSRRLEDAEDVGTGREGAVRSWEGCQDSFEGMLES